MSHQAKSVITDYVLHDETVPTNTDLDVKTLSQGLSSNILIKHLEGTVEGLRHVSK